MGETSRGATQFLGNNSTSSTSSLHALHDDDADVVDGDVAKGVHDGLPVEAAINLESALPLGCRWRVPLT